MNITEQDIFNFVYYPGKLNEEKKEYISSNRNLFEEQIRFCEETKAQLDNTEDGQPHTYILNKKPPVKIKEKPKYKLAADSISLDKSIRTETYIDASNNILAKVVFYPDKTKIFILSKENKPLNNFKLTIKPANKTYQIESSNEPLELPEGVEIDGINIEI